MHLEWIELRAFRSYEQLLLHPDPGVNIFIGDNGAGKTNILEAISLLSTLRGFRGVSDTAMIRCGEDAAIIRGGIEKEAGELRVEVEISATRRRRVLVNGKRPRRYSDMASEVPLVAFLPDDLDLVKRGPTLRREFLDHLGAQLSPVTGANSSAYHKAIQQRNSLLRQRGRRTDPALLDVWDEKVSSLGSRVLCDRLRLLAQLSSVVLNSYAALGGEGRLSAIYESAWVGDVDPMVPPGDGAAMMSLQQALAAQRTRDLDQRTTTVGPHRDELVLLLEKRIARTQASQGEQRLVALTLRIAAYQLLRESLSTAPLLLLDDVFSELDLLRSRAVLELLPKGQVFVTSARDDEVTVQGKRWKVEGGKVI